MWIISGYTERQLGRVVVELFSGDFDVLARMGEIDSNDRRANDNALDGRHLLSGLEDTKCHGCDVLDGEFGVGGGTE